MKHDCIELCCVDDSRDDTQGLLSTTQICLHETYIACSFWSVEAVYLANLAADLAMSLACVPVSNCATCTQQSLRMLAPITGMDRLNIALIHQTYVFP